MKNDSFDNENVVSKEDNKVEVKRKEKVALYSRSLAFSTSNGLIGPFISKISIMLGATGTLLGLIQSTANLLSTFLNPLFGRFSDAVKRRIPFIVVSTALWCVPYIFLRWIENPAFMILIVALVNLILSLGLPAWNAIQNELFPAKVRARLTGRIFFVDSIGAIITTIITGIILTYAFDESLYKTYIIIPVAIGIFLSIVGVLPFFRIEEPLNRIEKNGLPEKKTIKENIQVVKNNKPFLKYLGIMMIHGFFFSFCWPLFSIVQVSVFKADFFQMAILQIGFSLTTLLFIGLGAKLSDKIGRVKLIFFNRISLVLFPLAYLFAQTIWHLYIIHFIVASLITIGIPSVRAYLLDIVPPKEGGLFFGIFDMALGIMFFIGPLVSGFLVDYLNLTRGMDLHYAVNIILITAVIGRVLTALPFLSLKDMSKFPITLKEALKQLRLTRRLEPRG